MANGRPGRPLLTGRPLTERMYTYLDEQTVRELEALAPAVGVRGVSAVIRRACENLIDQQRAAREEADAA